MKWQFSIVVLTLILFVACEPRRQTTVRKLPPPPLPSAVKVPPVVVEDPAVLAIRESASVLRELTLQTANTLPDALLNRTHCFVLGLTGRSQALSSCRSAVPPFSWSTPETVDLTGPSAPGANLLIFILSDRAADALNAGTLNVADFSVAPGKTEKQRALLTNGDLGHDIITYRYAKTGLAGVSTSIAQIKAPGFHVGGETPGGGNEASLSKSPAVAGEYVDWLQSYFNTIMPTGIIIHHSAVIPSHNKVPQTIEDIDEYHASRGMDIECFGREYHVAYHYLIFPNGKVQAGRPERCEGAHARGYNSYIGVSLVGDFNEKDNPSGRKGPSKPTRQQLKSLIRLTRELQRRYDIPLQRILRHSDVASTLCPGERFAFKSFLLALQQGSGER